MTWPQPEDMDDRRLDELLFPAPSGWPSQPIRPVPDLAEVRRQLQLHKHLTLQLAWEEYRQTQPDGYGYSHFGELYDRWYRNQDVVLCCKSTVPARSCSWTGPAAPFRSTIREPAICRCSGRQHLLHAAYFTSRSHPEPQLRQQTDPLAARLRMNSTYPTPEGRQAYGVRRVKTGFSLMFVAGALSGLLGIGSGALKVIAMDRAMDIPFKVSTTTSNFMIGVTAAASAGLYLARGYIDPGLAMPVMLGVVAGSLAGTQILLKARVRELRIVFGVVVAALAAEMI